MPAPPVTAARKGVSKEAIARITLDEGSIRRRSPEIKHEMSVAITDLVHHNTFAPAGTGGGPYDVHVSVKEGRLAFRIKGKKKNADIVLSVQPLKSIIRDYFLICESYYAALKDASRGKIEAIDAGRRGVHNEGAELLQTLLKGKIEVDLLTARRLFTLICVLHIK